MNQKLKELRQTYQNQTSFTNHDRKQVLAKLNEPKQKEKPPLFPLKIIIPLAAALLLMFTLIASLASNDDPNTANEGEEDQVTSPEGSPNIEGYIVEQEDGRILVTGREQNEHDQYPATWYSNIEKDVQLGDEVRVWHSELAESYPSQGEADHLEVVKPSEEADMTQRESLASALQTLEDYTVTVINHVELFRDEGYWSIEIQDAGMEGQSASFSITVDGSSISTTHDDNQSLRGAEQVQLDISLSDLMNEDYPNVTYQGFEIEDQMVTVNLDNGNSDNTDQEALVDAIGNVIFEYESLEALTVNFNDQSMTVERSEQSQGDSESDSEQTESEEQNDSPPEPNMEELLNEYHAAEERIMETVDGQSNRLTHYNSKEEIVNDLNDTLSESHINYFFEEEFILEEDISSDASEGLYIRPTGGDTRINLEQDYQVNQPSETSYRVTQEINNELSGHVRVIYNINYQNDNWILENVDYEQL